MGAAHVCEMTLTRDDFLRLLPAALGHASWQEVDGALVHTEPGRSWRIELEPLPGLAVGDLRLERQRVRWTFSGYPEAESARLLERFERHYRRGGG